jgi:hypothetical protein
MKVQLWAKHVNKKCATLGTFWELDGNILGTLWVQQQPKKNPSQNPKGVFFNEFRRVKQKGIGGFPLSILSAFCREKSVSGVI